MKVRRYMGKDEYSASDYVFGKSFADQCDFYIENGQITEDQIPNLYASFNPEYLNQALDLNLEPAVKEE